MGIVWCDFLHFSGGALGYASETTAPKHLYYYQLYKQIIWLDYKLARMQVTQTKVAVKLM